MIAAGLAIGAYAVFARLSVASEQQRLVAEYREGEQAETAVPSGPSESAGPAVSTLPDPDAAQPAEGEDTSPATLAVLSIPSIDLEVAVREGVGSWSLRYSVGHYTPSVMPGETGNCVIMGHRNYTYGEFFNRLNEVEAGDALVLERKGVAYTYVVTETYVVEPDDTSVLDPSGDAVLTLITCTPIRVATHRLIVRAVLQTEQAAG